MLRRAVGRRCEASVAATAATAAGDHQAVIGLDQLADPLVIGTDDRSGRHAHDEVAAVAAVRLAAQPASARRCAEVAPALEVAEGRHPGLDNQHDVPALSTVAAIGTAARHVGLAAKGAGAVTTVAAGDQDAGAISEHLARA